MTGFRNCLVVGLLASLSWIHVPAAFAAEPDGPERLISRQDAIYISVLDLLKVKNRKGLRLNKADEEGIAAYYRDHQNPLIWVDENGMNDHSKYLRTVFERAGDFGLNPRDYSIPDPQDYANSSKHPAAQLAEAELKTSLATITYARHAQTGRFEPSSINKDLDKHPKLPNFADVLKNVAEKGDEIPAYLESFNPQHRQFKELKKLLHEIDNFKGKRTVRLPDGPSLGPGTSHPQIALLHERLKVKPMASDPEHGPAEEYYDADLEKAVQAFQESQGLHPDGVVGGNTREALNRDAGENDGVPYVKKATIIANMERWRWEARDLGERYVRVNIPEFMFRVVDHGKVVHEERIVAGSREHPTPIFSAEMQAVVFNPYWNVPKSILTNEILPAIRRDPSFIDRNRLEVVAGGRGADDYFFFDWADVDPNKLQLRQTPGAGNALGNVKFLFPNQHSVYMHDTPTKHLFESSVRAYSHGCMRVRNPLKFAEVLLAQQGWSSNRVHNAVGAQNDYEIPLKQKVPVHIMYFTLWIDQDGKWRQFNDIYGHDRRTRVALHLERAPSADVAEKTEDAGEHGLGN
jgi:murein L,D-transpeptidase YcbB/YkuD